MTTHERSGASAKSKVIQFMLSHGCVTAEQFLEVIEPILEVRSTHDQARSTQRDLRGSGRTRASQEPVGVQNPRSQSQTNVVDDEAQETQRLQKLEEKALKSVAALNTKLQMFNMMIRSTYYEKTRQRYFSLISTVDNDIMRKASHYTPKEFEFFRQVLEEIQDGPCGLEDLFEIGKNFNLANYKELVEEWCVKHWLYKDSCGIHLGPRGTAELDVLIRPQATQMTQPLPSTSAT